MGDLPNFGRAADPAPLAVWTGKGVRDCKSLCLKSTNCDAFTYLKKERKCVAHRKRIYPKEAEGCSFWSKTCPGLVGEQSKYLNFQMILSH